MTELKRCPFCGHTAVLRGKNGGKFWVVMCTNESCKCSTKGKVEQSDVINIWNRRYKEND
jgi:transcription elongation factor Elf1